MASTLVREPFHRSWIYDEQEEPALRPAGLRRQVGRARAEAVLRLAVARHHPEAEAGAVVHLRRPPREGQAVLHEPDRGADDPTAQSGHRSAEGHFFGREVRDAKFEQYLRDQAADTEQIAARRAERENLLQQIPKLAAAEAKLAKAIAVSEDMDALVAELKATQQARRQA